MKIRDVFDALSMVPDCRFALDQHIHEVVTDSRVVRGGDLFVAIQGEKFDGHEFIESAYQAGAIAAVVSKKNQAIKAEDFLQIEVPETTLAFGEIGQYWREQFSLPIIAITGSQGKTTVREMIASILRLSLGEDAVLVSQKNYNNHWGLPMTLVKLHNKHRVAVLELGMNHAGEIEYLTQLCQPTTGVITLAALTHTAGVKNGIEGIAKAKGELFATLSNTASAVINRDDPFYTYWENLLGTENKICSFGFSDKASVHFSDGEFFTPKGSVKIDVALPGEHNIKNALCAMSAVLLAQPNTELAIIKKALESIAPISGRCELLISKNNAVIINDSYNSSPASVAAALKVLSQQQGKKVLVLSDMAEVGENEVQAHQALAGLIVENKIDVFVAVGKLIKHAYEQYVGAHKAYFETKAEAEHYIKLLDQENTVFLIKGSRSMQMEKIVAVILS